MNFATELEAVSKRGENLGKVIEKNRILEGILKLNKEIDIPVKYFEPITSLIIDENHEPL